MQELQKILLKAKKQVFSNLSGENLTRLKGDGMELRDIKSYEWGDDVRAINWKATAKSGEILVNTYDEYKRLNISLVYLGCATMKFGSLRFKQDVVSEVFAYLLFSGVKNHDITKSIVFDNTLKEEFTPPKKINQIDAIVENIYKYNVTQKSKDIDYERLCHFINQKYKRGHIVILVGDFLTLPNFSLLHKKHQVYSIIVRDRLEENLTFSGDISLKNFGTNKSQDFHINSTIKQKYNKLLKEHDEKLKEEFIKNKIEYKKIFTDDDVYIKLKEIFK